MSDHWLGILGLAGTVIFGVLSLFLGWITLLPKRLAWGFSTETITTEGTEGDLSITFKERHFPLVHISRVAIWNDGRSAISGSEISKVDSLRIQFPPETEILSAVVVHQTSSGVGCSIESVSPDTSAAVLNFDILNRKQGFVIRVLHAGEMPWPSLLGTIRDVRLSERPVELYSRNYMTSRRIIIGAGLVASAFSVIGICLAILLVVGPVDYLPTLRRVLSVGAIFLGFMFVLLIAASGYFGPMPWSLLKGFSDER